jgi:hypothetical protein
LLVFVTNFPGRRPVIAPDWRTTYRMLSAVEMLCEMYKCLCCSVSISVFIIPHPLACYYFLLVGANSLEGRRSWRKALVRKADQRFQNGEENSFSLIWLVKKYLGNTRQQLGTKDQILVVFPNDIHVRTTIILNVTQYIEPGKCRIHGLRAFVVIIENVHIPRRPPHGRIDPTYDESHSSWAQK